LQKNATFGVLFNVNLNPVGDKKFLFSGCPATMIFFDYLDKKRDPFGSLKINVNDCSH
jgi:hypothetical protein